VVIVGGDSEIATHLDVPVRQVYEEAVARYYSNE